MKELKPIITSLLDVDFYKFTMMYLAFRKHSRVVVSYGFKNRSIKVALAKEIPEQLLRFHLDQARMLRFKKDELEYLKNIKGTNNTYIFNDPLFFYMLSEYSLPPYTLKKCDGQYIFETTDVWYKSILWETIFLSIINELYYQTYTHNMDDYIYYPIALQKLEDKIKILESNPGIKIIEFGTRRRFSKNWQEIVLQTLNLKVPQNLVGTSNVLLAKKYFLKPIGTMAHEVFMVYAAMQGMNEYLVQRSHNQVLQDWWEVFGTHLSIALPDTFGSEFFFKDMTKDQAKLWKGIRHDSGNPSMFAEQVINFYENFEINPLTKGIVFSDGLTIDLIVELYEKFNKRINVSFGWGTNLTNDLGFKPLSMVVKAISANGFPTVKLSDNMAKAMGEHVEWYKKVFGYSNTSFVETKY